MGTRANDIATVFKESNLIDSDRIASGAISSGKIVDNAVTEAKILNDAVTENKILNDAVTENKILNDAVTTNKILNDAVTGDKLANDITIANDLTVSNNLAVTNDLTISGIANTGIVSLANSNAVTYDLSTGNVAKWNRDTSPVDATNTLTFSGTAGGNIDGMGFTVMAFNGDNDSDRSITFAGDTGITVYYSDSATITWAGPNQYTLISGIVFDSASVLITSASLAGSV